MPSLYPYRAGVFIGRFQPYHLGHAQMLERALESVEVCIVVIGSAYQAPTPKNPFSWELRAQMIRQNLTPEQAERVAFLPLRDYYDGDRWAEALRSGVAQTIDVPAGSVALVSHYKDASSAYLRWFPQWHTLALPRQNAIDATPLREAFFARIEQGETPVRALTDLHDAIPAGTLAVLEAWAGHTDNAQELTAEWRATRTYRERWAQAPYPPILVTVDIVVECAGRVLIVERGGRPGKGCLALPGGFLDEHESLFAAALRELEEETGLRLDISPARAALIDVQVFDHPDRDARGRAITHAHRFSLPYDTPPEVVGSGDARAARWMTLTEIAQTEAAFYSDHFHILDRMCGVLPR
ncbi:MAG: bifunctional nicotinamide-nucleotide adenylyltransferase/Nudix hydroxylase [Burkholderiaceae bacterium]|nr:bifunctional nicotinamide-nucleotide adenylyltransferase/Nudix hydroxylase [Burkholderiaceae bacterium]